jgi:RNA polymerase sigma-70 factor (ECF subfamily)
MDQVAHTPVTADMRTQEHTWVQAALKGDRLAFMRLVEVYQRPVYNLCYRMLGDSAEAEDAAQETFIRAYTKLNTYQSDRKFSSWLFSIASHYCIDRIRQRRYQVVSWDDLPPWHSLAADEPEPEEATLAREARDRLHALLESLPPDYRAAIILRYWQDMPYEEIADSLNTSVSAIKSRLFRARQMMADAARQADLSGRRDDE